MTRKPTYEKPKPREGRLGKDPSKYETPRMHDSLIKRKHGINQGSLAEVNGASSLVTDPRNYHPVDAIVHGKRSGRRRKSSGISDENTRNPVDSNFKGRRRPARIVILPDLMEANIEKGRNDGEARRASADRLESAIDLLGKLSGKISAPGFAPRRFRETEAGSDASAWEFEEWEGDMKRLAAECAVELGKIREDFQEEASKRAPEEEKSGKTDPDSIRLQGLLSGVMDAMPSVLIAVDPVGRVTQWNREAEKATGVSVERALGSELPTVFPRLAGEMETILGAIEDREPRMKEKTRWEKNGMMRFSDIAIHPLNAAGVEGAVIRVDDVTRRVRIEEMMIQSEKMMAVGGLAAGMAHEINNPLAGIFQNVQVMKNRVTAGLPRNARTAERMGLPIDAIESYMEKRGVLEMIESVMDACMRAKRIVDNMLSFSRKSESKAAPHDLRSLLDKTLELAENDYNLKKKYDFREIEILREYSEGVPPALCEGSKIQQVFLNILKNGAQAMAEEASLQSHDEAEKTPCFLLRVRSDGDMVRVEIKDNGPGMDNVTRDRIFEPFFTTKADGVGTGLGLSVSHFIITNDHDGVMSVDSTPGTGTRFIIKLPSR